MVMDERFPRKTYRTDQTISRRDLWFEIWRDGRIHTAYNMTEARSNRPDGGATAINVRNRL